MAVNEGEEGRRREEKKGEKKGRGRDCCRLVLCQAHTCCSLYYTLLHKQSQSLALESVTSKHTKACTDISMHLK